MAVVGEAYIIIRPITAGFERSVSRDLNKLGNVGSRAGRKAGTAFHKAFGSAGRNIFTDETITKALKTQKAWASLQRTGFTLQAALSQLISGVGALAGGLVSLGSAALSAAPSVVALAGAFASLGIGLITARLALAGVGQAVSALNKQTTKGAADNTAAKRRVEDSKRALLRVIADNEKAILRADENLADSKKELTKAQNDLNRALKEGAEELQQLNFDAEDAALAEQRAANELEDARKTLARVQDLPPNSRARREAELAYREADLNLRRAKDRNADLRKEQERLAKEGVEGLDGVIKARENVADAEKGVIDAQKASEEAAIDAAQREEDARRDLARAKEDLNKKEGGGGNDPLAGLTESQKEFAKFLASLKPKIDELKEAAAASFLPKLREALTLLFSEPVFGVWKKGLGEVGDALGNASLSIAGAIADSGNLKDLGQLFTDASTNIETLGRIIGNTWGIALSVLNAAQPVTEKFLGYLETTTKKWENWLDNETNKKKLEDFFNEAGRVAAEFGQIFGNIFGGVFNLIKANTGPGSGGQILLDYFKEITANFKEFSGSAEGQNTLRQYFADAAENTKAILGFFGELFKIVLQLGADPNVKIFWDTLRGTLEPLKKILEAGNQAGPVFAELLVNVARIFAAFAGESGSLETFFGILSKVAGVIADIAESAVGQFFIKLLGYVSGAALAFGFLASGVQMLGYLFLGIFARAFNMVIGLLKILTGIVRGVIIVFNLLRAAALANPVGAIIVAIAALIGLFVLLYNKNEAFRNFVNEVWAKIKEIIGGFVDWFMEWGPKVWDAFSKALSVAWDAIKAVWDVIVTVVQTYIDTVTGIIKFVWDVLKTGLDLAWSGIKAVWEVIKTVVKTYIDTITGTIKFVWDVLKTGLDIVWQKIQGVWTTIITFVGGIGAKIKTAASGMWDGLKAGLQGVINTIIAGINWIIRALNKVKFTFPSWVPGVGGKGFGINISEISPVQLAKGGIVYPSMGGTLAQIAEAGRPERVEPLDPNGLSKRDKAMIQLLSGGAAGGMTFNVYPSPGMDEVELAAMISRQIAFQTRRGAA